MPETKLSMHFAYPSAFPHFVFLRFIFQMDMSDAQYVRGVSVGRHAMTTYEDDLRPY